MDKLLSIDFKHQQAKHYETGVTKSLLSHNGLELSEPMIFGIGSGIFLGISLFLNFMVFPSQPFVQHPVLSSSGRQNVLAQNTIKVGIVFPQEV